MDLTREVIFDLFGEYEASNGKLPTRDAMKEQGYSKHMFNRVFGSFGDAIAEYQLFKLSDSEDTRDKSKDNYLSILGNRLSAPELKAILDATAGKANKPTPTNITRTENGHFKFLATGDSHMGHKKFRQDWWNYMIQRGIEEKVNWMYHTGDILEGMSGRPGHVYELEKIGFEAQYGLAKELLENVPFEIRMITGNHDLWYMGKGDQGVNVGKRLSEALENITFLGNEEADDIVNGIKIKLWHGQDGSSYALSYRTQKFVEMLSGGEKPHILLAGHAHKSIFYETRNVQVFETGTLAMQTNFMRGKKLAAMTGFWIVDVWTNQYGISRIRPEWNPLFI